MSRPDIAAIRARAVPPSREAFILGGPRLMGQRLEASIGDVVALCDRVEALEMALRRIEAVAIAGRMHHPAFESIADVARATLGGTK